MADRDRDTTYGSQEATEQGESGKAGAQAGGTPGVGKQNAQGSQHVGPGRETGGEERKHFEPGHAPSEQGEKGHPSPHVIAQHQQGFEPRSGSHVHGDTSEELAQSGEPRGEFTRGNRHDIPGDRHPND